MKTFSQRVVEAALLIPKGKVTTYGAIAKACGGGGQAARSITAILGKYEEERKRTRQKGGQVPFHRIVYTDGKVWTNEEYRVKRLALYEQEGIKVDSKTGKIENFEKIFFMFK
ncbi:MGMT family protein [Candidatus Nomurabacteria bacterium]|jgi:methylated-DNA-protein-cysteine methyltransferase-like protein|nr:MAG: MGMT family protein [Candidatus Nomurabacteria bacterium]